jgi:hypothetical protein
MQRLAIALMLVAVLLMNSTVFANAPIEPQPTPDPCADQSAAIIVPQPPEQAVYMPLVVN